VLDLSAKLESAKIMKRTERSIDNPRHRPRFSKRGLKYDFNAYKNMPGSVECRVTNQAFVYHRKAPSRRKLSTSDNFRRDALE
jgi:hypothetical protein